LVEEVSVLDDLSSLVVVLVSPRNPLNIGAVARAMTNFGCADLRLVKVHSPSLERVESAVGPSAEVVAHAREFPTVADAVADCIYVAGTVAPGHRPPSERYALLPDAADDLRGRMTQGRVALLFGSEKTGLSNSDLSHCHSIIGIPTGATLASMNLGQAAAVCLYELSRGRAKEGLSVSASAPAVAADVERVSILLNEALTASDAPGTQSAVAEQELRSLILRLNLSTADAQSITGMLRHILWKLRHPTS
jgi:TrmH family RNA methyltransferase